MTSNDRPDASDAGGGPSDGNQPRRRRRRRRRRQDDGAARPLDAERPGRGSRESAAGESRGESASRSAHSDRPDRSGRGDRPRRSGRRERTGPDQRAERADRSGRGERREGVGRGARAERADRPDREDREAHEDHEDREDREDRVDRDARDRDARADHAEAEAPPALTETAFRRFDLPPRLLEAVLRAGYAEPTEIQERLIPLALSGRDVVARSRTGTGKTCAFALPALAGLDEVQDPDGAPQHGRGPVRVLAVCPTRELAIQVAGEFERLSHHVPVRTACVYGGTRMKGQVQDLQRSAVVVGTPGRLLDHMGRRTLDPSTIQVVVLDEVDRMYDLGFREDVDRILSACRNRRQTLLVSATLNDDVEALVRRHLGEHERIEVESRTLTVDEVDQVFYVVVHDRKRELLKAVVRERDPRRTIVFVRTRFTADRVAYDLKQSGHDAHEIHSGLPQRRREEILDRFRRGRLDLLVATDVAARGLDIEGVDHVFNYDIPQNPEDYVHRVGRTARMGKKGWAVTLVTPEDGPYLTAIEKLINREIRQETHPGFELPEKAKPQTPAAPEPTGLPSWFRPVRRRR